MRGLSFGLSHTLLLYFVYARSQGSSEAECTDSSEPLLLTNWISTKILCVSFQEYFFEESKHIVPDQTGLLRDYFV